MLLGASGSLIKDCEERAEELPTTIKKAELVEETSVAKTFFTLGWAIEA